MITIAVRFNVGDIHAFAKEVQEYCDIFGKPVAVVPHLDGVVLVFAK